ncbi:MAG: ADP-dependent glucokinase/phosphofructokinase [Pseudolysinimonas sp.]
MSVRLVLGLGGTVDFEIVWDSAVFEQLIEEYRIGPADLGTDVAIVDERTLVITILAFLELGAGGERFIASSGIVHRFAARFDTRVTLGGTGVRAGIAMDSLGVPTVQHLVSIDDNVRRLLPPSMRWISSAHEDTLDPHLIIQFTQGSRVRAGDIDIVAPAANRLIVANDPPNREMRLSPDLTAELATADAFLISGFNTMTDAALLDARLEELVAAMEALPPDALVFYEEAGFYVDAFRERVRDAIVDRVDIYSMNEDELEEYVGRRVDLLDPDAVAAAVTDVRQTVAAPTLVVHTRHWALAVGPRAGAFTEALRGAVTMAATRYRSGDGHTAAHYVETSSLPLQPDAVTFSAAVEQRLQDAVCVAAFELDAQHATTVGLGDTFVGGFLAAWSESGPSERPLRHTR